jgi:hypothetical protein
LLTLKVLLSVERDGQPQLSFADDQSHSLVQIPRMTMKTVSETSAPRITSKVK